MKGFVIFCIGRDWLHIVRCICLNLPRGEYHTFGNNLWNRFWFHRNCYPALLTKVSYSVNSGVILIKAAEFPKMYLMPSFPSYHIPVNFRKKILCFVWVQT